LSGLTYDCWISGTGDISLGDIVYLDAAGTTPFIGDGDYYGVQILFYTDSYSATVNASGVIGGPISICL
jgi:hypothetical protein